MWTSDDIIDVVCSPLSVLGCILSLAVAWALRWEATMVVPYMLVAPALLLYALSQRPRHPRLDWAEQVAVVTGSSGGLGSAIVAELRGKGCRVVGVDLAAPTATQDDAAAGDGLYTYLQADVSRSADIMALPEKIRSRLGCDATILISNAGIMVGKRVLDFDEGQFEKTITVNFTATYHAVRAFLPAILASGHGHIVATSSIMGYFCVSQLTDYVASKHALVGFLESLRLELDKKYKAPHISTTLLILGKLSTPLFARTTESPLAQFLLPTQQPSRVAKELVQHLERGESGSIYRPHLTRLAPLLKAMPTWVRNTVQWVSGADEALQPEDAHAEG